MKKIFFILLPLLLLTSCGSTFELLNGKSSSIKMERNKAILITTADNGYYGDKEYGGSGRNTTNTLRTKIIPYASVVDISPERNFKHVDKDDLLNYDYVIVPELYQWEDRATNMNFMPDKVILGLTVYDNTGVMLNHIEIKGESTKVTMANNDPIELVEEGLDIYIRQLFEL